MSEQPTANVPSGQEIFENVRHIDFSSNPEVRADVDDTVLHANAEAVEEAIENSDSEDVVIAGHRFRIRELQKYKEQGNIGYRIDTLREDRPVFTR